MKDKSKAIGGKARAASLTDEQKRKIASNAAKKRWGTDLPRATHEGIVQVGESSIPCAVLETGERVLTQSGFMKALGRARQAKGRQHYDGDVNMPAFLTAKNLKPFISNDLAVTSSQIEFRAAKGAKAFGYAADLLPSVCEVFLQARDAGVLTHNQAHIAKQADILMRGLARVGIASLVDEATGYQHVRDRLALQKILDKYITDELSKWTLTFPDEFYQQLFRLKGIDYPTANGMKPSYVGHWTNDIVYDRLAPGVKDELKTKNPRQAKTGSRKHKHHQFLTKDFGHPELRELLSNVIFMMKGCADWDQFKRLIDKSKPKFGSNIEMDI